MLQLIPGGVLSFNPQARSAWACPTPVGPDINATFAGLVEPRPCPRRHSSAPLLAGLLFPV
ncbi:MAG: hypothetical protein KGJ56_06325 [Gammaproteobacteria bacterium]|nr:hypothetical protein [Gammaproteobacteria bacterium]